jgi:hypothetical protein
MRATLARVGCNELIYRRRFEKSRLHFVFNRDLSLHTVFVLAQPAARRYYSTYIARHNVDERHAKGGRVE